jgi:ElaB/YqjD/DUF883 family membrane-anchored ribosome-binding protein
MISSFSNPLQHDIETALDEVARSLQTIAKDAAGLSGELSAALVKASADVTQAAESLRKHATAKAQNVAQKAALEIKEHPIAALAAAITAAAALVSVISAEHHKH